MRYRKLGKTRLEVSELALGGRPQPFDPQDKDARRRSLEQSLRTLQRDCIDLLIIHKPQRPGWAR